eukprot:2777672-Alexandrium_andersonii.AAC.2
MRHLSVSEVFVRGAAHRFTRSRSPPSPLPNPTSAPLPCAGGAEVVGPRGGLTLRALSSGRKCRAANAHNAGRQFDTASICFRRIKCLWVVVRPFRTLLLHLQARAQAFSAVG